MPSDLMQSVRGCISIRTASRSHSQPGMAQTQMFFTAHWAKTPVSILMDNLLAMSLKAMNLRLILGMPAIRHRCHSSSPPSTAVHKRCGRGPWQWLEVYVSLFISDPKEPLRFITLIRGLMDFRHSDFRAAALVMLRIGALQKKSTGDTKRLGRKPSPDKTSHRQNRQPSPRMGALSRKASSMGPSLSSLPLNTCSQSSGTALRDYQSLSTQVVSD